ncbi:MAG: lysophospholipid acyltransferase family protein [Nostocoides sp.]
MEWVYAPVIGLARSVFLAQGLKFDIRGGANVPASGGAVMAINHISYLDYLYAGLAARPAGRMVRFMAKEEVFANPVAGPLLRSMRHIPVDRAAGMGAFRAAVNALKDGEIVGVFPEATISQSLEIKAFKSGAVRMAQAAGAPILPTTVWGSQRLWTKGVKAKRLGRSNVPIFVTVGAPLTVARPDNAEEATARLREVMIAQLRGQQDRYPPLTGDDLRFLPARLGGTAPAPPFEV